MTKEEFKGFSSAAQHDMVLEALVRVTKNLEIMEEISGKPFVGTTKQRRNDVKLLTILAEAFCKNELGWNKKAMATRDKKSKPQPFKPLPESMSRGNTKPVVGVVGSGKRMTVEEYVKENIKESRGKYYGKEEK